MDDSDRLKLTEENGQNETDWLKMSDTNWLKLTESQGIDLHYVS